MLLLGITAAIVILRTGSHWMTRMSETFRTDQAALLRQIEQHQHANQSYLDAGVHLLELAQKAVVLYDKQPDMREKRKLLDFVCSNSPWKDGKLIPTYRKPFDMLAVTNISHQKTKAASSAESSLGPRGSPGRTRTSDQLVNSQPLYRLSYRGRVPEIIPHSAYSSRIKCGDQQS